MDINGLNASASNVDTLQSRASKLISSVSKDAAGAAKSKIDKSAHEFEAILLAQWLGQAEESFGTVPGGDGNDKDRDPGHSQFQSMGVQAVAKSMSQAGGIGIASMLQKALEKRASSGQDTSTSATPEVHVQNPEKTY